MCKLPNLQSVQFKDYSYVPLEASPEAHFFLATYAKFYP